MPTIQVVGAIIIENHKLLAAQRAKGRSLGGFWEFPGGKVEPDEDPENAIERELREEFGVKSDILEKFSVEGRSDVKVGQIVLHCFYAKLLGEIIKTTDHDELRWVTEEEAATLNWAPSDVPIVQALIQKGFDYGYGTGNN